MRSCAPAAASVAAAGVPTADRVPAAPASTTPPAPDPARRPARRREFYRSCRGQWCGRAAARCRERSASPRRVSASTVASVRPTPLPPMVTSRSHRSPSSAFAIDDASRPAASRVDDIGAGRASAFRDQVGRYRVPGRGNIDRSQARTAHRELLQPSRTCQQQIERAKPPPGSDGRLPSAISPPARRTPCPGIASAKPETSDRYEFDRSESTHAIASTRHGDRRLQPRPAVSTSGSGE